MVKRFGAYVKLPVSQGLSGVGEERMTRAPLARNEVEASIRYVG